MANVITMPKLGLTMKEGTVNEWLLNEGDRVNIGDELLVISAEKLTNTVESDCEGIIRKILVEEGEKVPCQTPLCIIGDLDEDITEYE